MTTTRLIAVYGTLKKGFGNHRVMEDAGGRFAWTDYLQFERMSSWGFPRVKFSTTSNKWLKVELYEVEEEWILNHLDRLEGCGGTERSDNFYNRINKFSLSWKQVETYEINHDIEHGEEPFVTHNDGIHFFYEWTRK